ncbi:MAG: hypothetical protein K0U68_06890 [Gammaproteobacteria bacterium]|nr:hypothetical protein [Gammaproteobacteria bacterium]
MVVIIYLCVSLLIGLLGIHRKLGFWGYFFGSIIFTPFVGLILLFASDKRKT